MLLCPKGVMYDSLGFLQLYEKMIDHNHLNSERVT